MRDHFGPRLTAFVAYLTAVCRIPRRGVEELLATALGTTISLGTIQKLVGMQKRNVLGFLTDAVRCYRLGLPAPSLLPQQAEHAQ